MDFFLKLGNIRKIMLKTTIKFSHSLFSLWIKGIMSVGFSQIVKIEMIFY
jgi:hypothetical protein